jgi:hypothetical protein
METPLKSTPGTPKAGAAGRGNMMNRRHLALDPMAARRAKRPVDPELLKNKTLVNLTTGYVDPSVAHMFRGVKGGPRVVPQELLQSKFPGWGAIGAAAAPKAHPFGVRPGASMGAWGSGGPPVSMDMAAAGMGAAGGFPNNNPKAPNGKRRNTEEEKQGGGRRKTYKSRKVKKLKTRSKRK